MADEQRIEKITDLVATKFKSFGGGQSSNNNPVAAALSEKPPIFAVGVDIKEVVRFIVDECSSTD